MPSQLLPIHIAPSFKQATIKGIKTHTTNRSMEGVKTHMMRNFTPVMWRRAIESSAGRKVSLKANVRGSTAATVREAAFLEKWVSTRTETPLHAVLGFW